MQRFAVSCETHHEAAFPSARIFVLFKDQSRQQSFFYFGNGQVIILSFLVAMS